MAVDNPLNQKIWLDGLPETIRRQMADLSVNTSEMDTSPASEEFWQRQFEEMSELLATAVPRDALQCGSKSHIGGKNLENKHRNIVDFLHQQTATFNVTLVEIKTPDTKLIGGAYRDMFLPT